MPKPKRRQHTPAQIQRILRDLADSGLSRREFATRRRIPLSTLHAWIARHNEAAATIAPDLIPVGTIGSPGAAIEIELVSGEIVRLSPGVGGEDLRVVLAELRRC